MAKTSSSSAQILQQLQTRTEQSPQDCNAWKALGRHLLGVDELSAARAAAQQANSLAFNDAEARLLLAQIEFKAGSVITAQRLFREVLAIHPDHVEAMQGLAAALADKDNPEEALVHLEAVLAKQPDRTSALALKFKLLAKLGHLTEAVKQCEALQKADPANALMYYVDLGNYYRELGNFKKAEACYRKAAESPIQRTVALSNLLTLVHYMPEKSAADIHHTCKVLGSLFTPNRTPTRPCPADQSPQRTLRVGIFSEGFCLHPVGSMTVAAFEQLSTYGIEVYAYTTNSTVDAITERMKALARKWTSISRLAEDEFADLLREDGIDILIDLAGHHSGSRMLTVALEPAPIIIKWVGGLINTTGVKAFDYLITDSVESPPGSDSMYTEKLIRMPDDYICYMPPSNAPDVGELPALKNGYVTFGCFNNSVKLNEVVLAQWAQLMHDVPGSHLFLKSPPLRNPETQKKILALMSGYGINSDRIRLEGRSNHYELLNRYNEIDIALDPWPYSGGLTTCEGMLMGVPAVTLPGPTFAGRHSATHLANAGMPELIVESWEQYRERAAGLAANLNTLSTIRTHLRRILIESPVCDAPKFGRHLADALRAVWQRYCEDKPRAAMAFTADGLPWFEDESEPTIVRHPEIESDTFEFSFKGRIVAIDHGAALAGDDKLKSPHLRQALNVIAIDPAKAIENHDALLASGTLRHYQSNVALGDGNPTQLRVCLDAKLNSTLEPLRAQEQLISLRRGGEVLTRLPLPTTRLDDIEGVGQVDLLALDDRHNNLHILQGARGHLPRTLIVQVRVLFSAIYHDQPDLGQLTQELAQHGLRLLRLNDAAQHNYLPAPLALHTQFPGSQLLNANAVFVPTDARLRAMDRNQRQKLAFLLHYLYGATDLAHLVLGLDCEKVALRFLKSAGWLSEAAQVAVEFEAVADTVHVALRNVASKEEAETIVRVIRSFPQWRPERLADLIAQCEAVLLEDGANNTAHFTLVHALNAQHAKAVTPPDTTEATSEMRERLKEMGWENKGALYAYWLKKIERASARPSAPISAILIANRFKPEIIENLALLREQCSDLEIVFVNNGAPRSDFSAISATVDVWIDLKGNSGAYLARNIGAVFSSAKILLFVDDDGLPEPDFVDAHLRTHSTHRPISLRGVYRPRSKDGEAPPHYHLGDEICAAPPVLEGNVSFARDAFVAVGGWGDYILFGHGGFDVSHRLNQHGFLLQRQLYTPSSILRHDYLRGEAHATEKFAKQNASWHLLDALGHVKSLEVSRQAITPEMPAVRHTLPQRLVVSLTSYQKRFSTLHETLECLTNQSVKPDRIILWISYEDQAALPDRVRLYGHSGVEIKYCRDIRSYKKIIPTLREEGAAFIVTADDDVAYPRDWLEKLVQAWPNDYRTVVAWRAHTIVTDPANGTPLPYAQWEPAAAVMNTPSERIFPTGVGGVLYPPGVFHQDVFDEDTFQLLCPDADDVWLYAMCRRNGAKFKTVGEPFKINAWTGTQQESLWHKNLGRNQNDKWIQCIIDRYGVFDCLPAEPRSSRPPLANSTFDSAAYWSNRYRLGGNSGSGSYGRLAQFKAEVLNALVKEFDVASVIEFGCGDGAQLQLADYPKYLGLDITQESVQRCRSLFSQDQSKAFKTVADYAGEQAELALSLDVIFHLIEDHVFDAYMHRLLGAAQRYAIVYSSNHESSTRSVHVRHRKFVDWINKYYSNDFKLIRHIPNRYPLRNDPENESFADFYIFEKIGQFTSFSR